MFALLQYMLPLAEDISEKKVISINPSIKLKHNSSAQMRLATKMEVKGEQQKKKKNEKRK